MATVVSITYLSREYIYSVISSCILFHLGMNGTPPELKEIHSADYELEGLNAYQYLRLLDADEEFSYHRKVHRNWNMYFKESLHHR